MTRRESVYITVSSLKDAFIELNWDCTRNDRCTQPEFIALYNCDIRKSSDCEKHLYVKIRAREHPKGYYRTQIKFNLRELPGNWCFSSTYPGQPGPQNLPYWIASFTENHEILEIQSMRIQPTWMGDNTDSLGHQRIGKLIIPGTHNSACCGEAPFFTKDYVLNQDRTVYEQLVFGIRYLDLRVACYFEVDDRPAVQRVERVFDEIKKFLAKSPKEILIIDFHRFPRPKKWLDHLHEMFIHYTYNELGSIAYVRNSSVHPEGPTLNEIWAARKNIIFAHAEWCYTEKYLWLWPSIPHAWADTTCVSSLKQYLENFLNRDSTKNVIFHAIMAELTPTFKDVLLRRNKLRKLANDVNPNLTRWIMEWNDKVNIVTSDFFLGNDLINLAIYINTSR
ncbi:hypothetical protein WA026_005391 [Henosepilachna vigintioctopunctata]|uniref:Uncharacterized protein n=1 Tax=Henosepilachna vigintioctopunctata TaxID=420089 RepID=A0AAW1TW57_9CUCU